MSELLFLGTGAADWDIRQRCGFFRRNSAALLDGRLMLDCGRHVFDFAEASGAPYLYGGVTDILFTHSHGDHFSAESVRTLAGKHPLRVWGDGRIGEALEGCPGVTYTVLEPYREVRIGKYAVMPLIAGHSIPLDDKNTAMHHIVTTPEGKTLFYGLDGAWFFGPSWLVMKQYRFDVMVLDCTVGDSDDWRLFEHNTIPMLRTMTKGIREAGLLKDGGRLIASHMARTLHGTHEETAAILAEFGMIAAYDGMKVGF